MDVSIIILNYNTRQMTSECIDSVILNTSDLNYEIIVVDNASTDGSKEYFEQDKRIEYIYSDVNKGFGAGNNLGVKYAKGKYVFLLNSDTLLKNNAIKMLYDFSELQSEYCVCGAWLEYGDGSPNVSKISFPRMNVSDVLCDLFSKKRVEERDTTQPADCVCGADMFLPKVVYEQVGGFDENIFLYGEEVELQFRLKKLGVFRYVVSGPKIIHFGGGSSGNYNKYRYRGHFYILKKHMSALNYYGTRIYYAVNLSIKKLLGNSSIRFKDIFMRI